MKTPLFADPQFLDATAPGGLNPAFNTVSGDFTSLGVAGWGSPGLLAPESMTLSFASLVATVGLPSPWGIVSSGGIVVRAHGTQTGQDTQSYTVSFGPLVPGTGSVVAYLAATITSIQQTPIPIPGPPPGQPAYNPNFVPVVGYAQQVYTVALAAVTGGIDNVNTFELAHTTLTAGQSSITTWTTAGQFRAPERNAWPAESLTSGGVLSPGQADGMLVYAASGVTVTLPPASGAGGLLFGLVNPLSVTGVVATTGSDLFTGLAQAGLAAFAIPASGSALLWANPAGFWQVLALAPSMFPGRLLNVRVFNSNGTYTPTGGMNTVLVLAVAGGGGGGGVPGQGAGGAANSGGGCSGGWSYGSFTAAQVGASQAIAVGAGGVGGVAGSNAGNPGGSTTFGSLMSALGGNGSPAGAGTSSGGMSINAAGTPIGTGTGGNIYASPGNAGTQGILAYVGGNLFSAAGAGGVSVIGAGGVPVGGQNNGNNGTLGGGGGGGSSALAGSSSGANGGNGGNGCVIIWEYS